MSGISTILDAIKRFVRDSEAENMRVVAWPTCDPNFRIGGLQPDGDYVLLFGIDEREREGMLVLPAAHLAVQMRCEPANAERSTIGFISSERVKT